MKELLIKHNIQELNENEINDLFVIYSGILSNYYKDKKEGYQILETFLDGSPINLTNPSKFEEISKVYWEIIQDQKEKELKNKLIKKIKSNPKSFKSKSLHPNLMRTKES